MSSVKVAVRVRPFNDREKNMNAILCISMEGKSTTIENKLPFCLQVHSGDGPMNMEADDNFLSSILRSEMTKTQGPPKENTQNKIKIVQEKENTLDSNRTSKEICQTLLHHQIVPAKIY